MRKEITYYLEDTSRLSELSKEEIDKWVQEEPYHQALRLLSSLKDESNTKTSYASHFVEDYEPTSGFQKPVLNKIQTEDENISAMLAPTTETKTSVAAIAHPLADDALEDIVTAEVDESIDKIVVVNEVAHESADDTLEENIYEEIMESQESLQTENDVVSEKPVDNIHNEEVSPVFKEKEVLDDSEGNISIVESVLEDSLSLKSKEEINEIINISESNPEEKNIEEVIQTPVDKAGIPSEPISESEEEIDEREPTAEMQSLEDVVFDIGKKKKKKKKKKDKSEKEDKKKKKKKKGKSDKKVSTLDEIADPLITNAEVNNTDEYKIDEFEGVSQYTHWLLEQKPVNGNNLTTKKKKEKKGSTKEDVEMSKKTKSGKKNKKKSKPSKTKSTEVSKKEKKKKKKKPSKQNKTIKKAKSSLEESEIILSEPLAEILASQGHTKKAKLMYQRLSLIFPEKSSYFAAKIKNLKKEK